RSSSFSVEQTFWRESDKSQGFGDGVPEAGAGMPLGTVPLSASSTGSGVSPTILPIDSATEPLIDMRKVATQNHLRDLPRSCHPRLLIGTGGGGGGRPHHSVAPPRAARGGPA